MYIHIGSSTVLRTETIVGIFDLDNTTISKRSRDYLNRAEKEGRVINVAEDLPKSFIVTCEENKNIVYLSQLSTTTLLKRTENNEFI